MRKGIAILILAFASFSAHAEEGYLEFCKSIDSIAANTLKGRYNGIPMSTFVENWAETRASQVNTKLSEDVAKLVLEIIKDAYEQPDYATEDFQARQVASFRNKWYLNCIEILGK